MSFEEGNENYENSSCAEGQELQATEQINASVKENKAEGSIEQEDEKTVSKELESQKELDIYKQVVEKLDIKPNQNNQDVQQKFLQDSDLLKESYLIKKLEKSQQQVQVENIVAQDFAKIQNLMQLGLINSLQGQNLKTQVLKKAFDKIVQNETTKQNLSPAGPKYSDKNEIFREFSKDNPDFFESDGRKEVMDYLKSDDVIIGKDELKKISSMIESVEKNAIDRYLKKIAYEKNLKNSNEAAKQKLTANAQNISSNSKNLSRTFTREQIGKMSGAEFIKNEPFIMDQLRKGLIR